MRNRWSIIFLVVAIAWSCIDDNSTSSFNGTYEETEVISIGIARVYNNQGEVKDPTTVNPDYWLDTLSLNYIPRYFLNNSWLDTIHFKSGRTATIRAGYANFNCQWTREMADLVFTRLDTSSGFTYGDVKSRTTSYWLGQVKPEVFDVSLSSSTAGNYMFRYKSREKFLLRGHYDGLVAPYIAYIRKTVPYTNGESGTLNNSLSPEFYKNLKPNEILTVLEFQVLFKKKK